MYRVLGKPLLNIFSYVPLSFSDCRTDTCCLYFLSKCNMRCQYCQNYPELNVEIPLEEEKFRKEIEENWSIGIVKFSGGEPTLQREGLLKAAKIVQDYGKKLAMDTNGSKPKVVEKFLKYDVAEIAVDYKAPASKYPLVTKTNFHDKVLETIKSLKDFNVDFEVRTTVAEPIITLKDLRKIAEKLGKLEVPLWVIQFFKPTIHTPKTLKTPKKEIIERINEFASEYSVKVKIRE